MGTEMGTVSEFKRRTKIRECVFGLVGDGFVIVAADASVGYNIFSPNTTEDKITVLDAHKLVAAVGYPPERHRIMYSIEDNWDGITWTTESTADFMRTQLSNALNNGQVERLSMLVAGYDEVAGPSLYHIDCKGSMKKVEKGAFDGDGCYYNLRMVNNRYDRGMSLEEAIRLVDDCMAELKSRRVVKSPYYGVKIVDKDGVRVHIPVENCVFRTDRD